MKIQLLSDLHIEFGDYTPNCKDADVVVFAGDIHIGTKGLDWIESLNLGKPIIYVLGNHEYYKNAYPHLLSKLSDRLDAIRLENPSSDIHVLENKRFTIGDICFHGATLWTDFNLFSNKPLAVYDCKTRMNDYRAIRKSPRFSKLHPDDTVEIHKESLKWLSNSLKSSTAKANVVVTHHAPSSLSIPYHHQESVLSCAYASRLDDFVDTHNIDYWFHGHMHNNMDYDLYGCRVICNPKGYAGEENKDFKSSLVLEIA